jgi:dolichol-phosphate mannosyltransferase
VNLINVVAPIYNEEGLVKEFVKQVSINLETFTKDYKILLIDDGSKDKSWNEITEICENNRKIIGIKLSKNFGHHYAITAGIHNSDSEWVVVMDSDLQDRPEVIPELFQKATEGFDVVFVNRTNRPESFWYKSLQKIFYFILRVLSGIKFDSNQANFSIINKKVVEAFKQFPEQSRFYGSTIKWLGFKKSYIRAQHGKRFHGKPSYTFKKRIRLASDIILAFSDRPLKFAAYLGLIISLISFIMIGWIIFQVLRDGFSVVGWASLMASIFLIGGMLIFILGIVGIYISKIFNEVKHRPLFVIENKLNS